MQFSTLDEAWGTIKPKVNKKKLMSHKVDNKHSSTDKIQETSIINEVVNNNLESFNISQQKQEPKKDIYNENEAVNNNLESFKTSLQKEIIKNEGTLAGSNENNTEIELLNLLLHMSSGIFIIVLIDLILSYKK